MSFSLLSTKKCFNQLPIILLGLLITLSNILCGCRNTRQPNQHTIANLDSIKEGPNQESGLTMDIASPQLKLIPLGPTALVGIDQEIKLKIEKEPDSGNVDVSKLELIITEVLNTDVKLNHKGIEVVKLSGSELGAIGSIIKFAIQPGTDLVASFVFQLIYQGNTLGMPEAFAWMEPADPTQELFGAASRNDVAKIKKLLQIPGINVNVLHRFLCQTPLHLAIQVRNQAAMGELLAAEGIHVNLKDKCGNTPLHKAAIVNNEAAVSALLAKGANVDIQGEDGNTPSHIAIKGNTPVIVKLLLDQGAKQHIQNKQGKTPQHLAQASNNQEIKKLLDI